MVLNRTETASSNRFQFVLFLDKETTTINKPPPRTLYKHVILYKNLEAGSSAGPLIAKRFDKQFLNLISQFDSLNCILSFKTSSIPIALSRIKIYFYNGLKFFCNQFQLLETNDVFR